MADLGGLIRSIPPVTRVILLSVACVTGPCLLALLSPRDVGLSWLRVGRNWEIWRPFTAFFFGGGGFPLLFDFFLIYRNSTSLEKDTYLNVTSEYAWTHVMLALFIMILNIPFSFPFLFRSLLHAQTYLWCKANPTLKVSIFGLLTLPTGLYPFALIGLDLITGGPGKALAGVLGLLSGHLWWFLSTFLPVHAPTHIRRANPLATPQLFKRLFEPAASRSTTTGWGGTRIAPRQAGQGATTAQSTARPSAADAVRHRWGSGQRLGSENM